MARKWTPEELRTAVDYYLKGHGLDDIAGRLGRTLRAVEDVVKHDLCRDYRGVATLMAATLPRWRGGRRWSPRERDFLKILLRRLDKPLAAAVLGRAHDEVAAECARTVARVRTEGFGL